MKNKKGLLGFFAIVLLTVAVSFFVSKTFAAEESSLYTIVAWNDGDEMGVGDLYIHNIDPEDFSIIDSIAVTSIDGDVETSNGASVDPTTNIVYAVLGIIGDKPEPVSERCLTTINMSSGEATIIGTLSDNFSSIAFDENGQLYGLTGDGGLNASSLFEIDKETANSNMIASYEANMDGEALAYNFEDEKLYRATGNNMYAINSNDPENPEVVYEDIEAPLSATTALYHISGDDFYLVDWMAGVLKGDILNQEAEQLIDGRDEAAMILRKIREEITEKNNLE